MALGIKQLDCLILQKPREDLGASLIVQLVKNPPAMQKTWVQSLGSEDPLEKGKAIHFSVLAWRIPWTVHRVAKSLTFYYFHFQRGSVSAWGVAGCWYQSHSSSLTPTLCPLGALTALQEGSFFPSGRLCGVRSQAPWTVLGLPTAFLG